MVMERYGGKSEVVSWVVDEMDVLWIEREENRG